MIDYFKTLARYNAWANERIYKACHDLSTEDYFLDRKAFFSSIHGTLNHLLVGDRIWLGRYMHVDSGITSLNQLLYPDLVSLSQARTIEDQRLIDFIDTLNDDQLKEKLTFNNLSGQTKTGAWIYLLGHLFNHQTHHRGQVHNMLSQAGLQAPVLDLHYYLS